jgi:hypothetical protein
MIRTHCLHTSDALRDVSRIPGCLGSFFIVDVPTPVRCYVRKHSQICQLSLRVNLVDNIAIAATGVAL